jgi:hypothetical protein
MILIGASLAVLAVGPALAKPNNRPGELMLHQMIDYNGDYYTVDSDRSTTVEADWVVRSISIPDGETWEICARTRFRDCIQLSQSVPDVAKIGLTGNQIGSIRRVTT